MPMTMPDGSTSASMPQDVRAGRDGKHFYVADMVSGGVFVVDGASFTVTQFIPTGVGTHGITPSRDGAKLYIANRGSMVIGGAPHGPGSVSVLDMASNTITATWEVPGGGSPDMGNLNAAGTELWLSGRYDSEVYVFDTVKGALAARVKVGAGPHGLTVWPQPGRFSLGHTGNMR
jgi:YVTN family beta-propeller protein